MKNRYQQVDGYPDLVKDLKTNMILNINTDRVMQARKIREQKAKERDEIEALKSDVKDIKQMLQKLIEISSNA